MTIDYRDAKLLWPGLYKAVHEILGDAHVVVPLGDELVAGKVNASSFEAKAMGAVAPSDLTWTPRTALSAWATPLDLTAPGNWKGVIPVLTFNGSSDEGETPDDIFYSRDDSSNEPFSVGAWAQIADTASVRNILAKWDTAVAVQEWRLRITGGDILNLTFRDDSAGLEVARDADAAIPLGAWIFIVATYDGTGGTTAMNGVAL
ncbi:MAG: hypothetical protein O3B65_00125 [Chloroflexi bacterium]|nr:hypothetical protein [Chloroflexota bacterium]